MYVTQSTKAHLVVVLTDWYYSTTCISSADTKTISGLSVVLGKLVTIGKLELIGDHYQLTK